MTAVTTRDTWLDLLSRWDCQQAVYIACRERVYEVMFEVLTHLLPVRNPVVLDLACGPGAISGRLLHRLPTARCVAVDVDPVLLEIGHRALGDCDGRLRWVRADLRDPRWVSQLSPDGPGGFDAVLSSTALHWLEPPVLGATYRHAFHLLRPGGLVMNADYLPHPPGSRLRVACDAIAVDRQREAVAAGSDTWEDWWDAVRAEPSLANALARRDGLWPDGCRDWTGASHHFHESALREAGFTETGIIWQDLQQRIMVGLK